MGILILLLCICPTLSAMNSTSYTDTLCTIYRFNKKNAGEVTINPRGYLEWLNPRILSEVCVNPTNLAYCTNLCTSLICQQSACMQKAQPTNATIISKMIRVNRLKRFPYDKDALKPLWRPLKEYLSAKRINSLLGTLIKSHPNMHDYTNNKRFLVAAVVLAGADPNHTLGRNYISPLIEAVLHDDAQAVELLLERHANPNEIFTQSLQVPIIWYANSLPVAELLITHGARLPIITNLSECDQERYEQLQELFEKCHQKT